MKLKQLRIQNFRNHTDVTCEFGSHTTLLYGNNGAGKTAIIEAVYEAYRGVSWRGSDSDILRSGSEWYRIDLIDDSEFRRCVVYDYRGEMKSKQFTIDDKTSARLPYKYKHPLILFTPNDLRLIDGSPTRRRDYLDTVIVQYNPHYMTVIRRYERALGQRNKLLKRSSLTPTDLFPWNVILAENGAYIINARIELTETINRNIARHYQSIAKKQDDVSVSYTSRHQTSQRLLAHHEANYERDRLYGNTLAGPHRDDMMINLRGKLANDIASRGEMRTLILAIKYIETELITNHFGNRPIILLDDVYGELDHDRRTNLTSTLGEHQIIITSTDHTKGLPRGTVKINLHP